MTSSYYQNVMPISKSVKWLIGINVAIWLVGVLILQGLVFKNSILFQTLGLLPYRVIYDFWFWQPVTYMFVHSTSVFHVMFNMLALWWFGSELEFKWGARFFLAYYFVCGVGAAVIYLLGVVLYALVFGNALPMLAPVVGASGAVYGLLLAYGILFGDRVIYFMMLFPMKAKHFVLIMGFIELVTLLDAGLSSGVANLAHLGGILVGFLFLNFWTKWRHRLRRSGSGSKSRRLKLVVDNEKTGDSPRYWN